MANYAWVITRSYIANSIPFEDRYGSVSVPVDIAGPSGASDAILAKAASDGVPFRMYDDDGILYYVGRCYSDEGTENGLGEEFFGPLEDYGGPGAGCTEIRYRMPSGKWETL